MSNLCRIYVEIMSNLCRLFVESMSTLCRCLVFALLWHVSPSCPARRRRSSSSTHIEQAAYSGDISRPMGQDQVGMRHQPNCFPSTCEEEHMAAAPKFGKEQGKMQKICPRTSADSGAYSRRRLCFVFQAVGLLASPASSKVPLLNQVCNTRRTDIKPWSSACTATMCPASVQEQRRAGTQLVL